MKTAILLAVAFVSHSALACMPYIPGIKHNVAMIAIKAVHEDKGASVLDLVEKDVTDLKFSWIKSDAGYQCHDRENAIVKLKYKLKDGTETSYEVDVQNEHPLAPITTVR